MFLSSSAFALQSGDFTYDLLSWQNEVAITGYTGAGGAVVIPTIIDNTPVKMIFGGFQDKTSITSITMPDAIRLIGDHAFSGCTGLTSINIPGNVTNIGDYAFSFCTSLTNVSIPSIVTEISPGTFFGCTGLTNINIPGNVTNIGDYAFSSCTGLTSINIPGNVTNIGDRAFEGCRGLSNTSLSIPSKVVSIGDFAFSSCGLIAAYFCGNAPTMGENVFLYCATGFTIYYIDGSIGFTSPFYGFPIMVSPTGKCKPAGSLCPAQKALGEDNPKLENLRDFRDSRLANSVVGRKVIQIYYTNADSINAALERSPALRAVTRRVLEVIAPMVGKNEE